MSNNDEITALRAEVERLRIENIQTRFALGYPMPADLEHHILPSNPFKCGTCDARAALEEARAAIAAQPAPSPPRSWMPIETAPKTRDDNRFGPLIVLASTSGHRAIGYWGERCSRWGWVNPHDHQIMDYWNAFTHWMPLPPAPEKEEA